jgi:hypothetical protein
MLIGNWLLAFPVPFPLGILPFSSLNWSRDQQIGVWALHTHMD